MKEALADKISSLDNTTKTITITQENIESVTNLYLQGRNITNIKGIEEFTNLTDLALNWNQISDADILDNELEDISNFNISYQRFSITPETKTVELPKIFLQVKDQNSKLYTSEDYILENCTLNSDGTSVTINEETTSASVSISGGTANGTILEININLLKLKVSKTTEELTNQNVGVTITADKTLRPVDGWELFDDQMTLTKRYMEPTTEEIKIYDIAGNETDANIEVKFKDNKLEIEEVKVEESKGNPKTGDIIFYVGLTLLIALATLIISNKYIARETRRK